MTDRLKEHRRTGRADIVRELIDGGIGHRESSSNVPLVDRAWWSANRERLEQVARSAAG